MKSVSHFQSFNPHTLNKCHHEKCPNHQQLGLSLDVKSKEEPRKTKTSSLWKEVGRVAWDPQCTRAPCARCTITSTMLPTK